MIAHGRPLAAAVAAVALLLAGCSGGEDAGRPDAEASSGVPSSSATVTPEPEPFGVPAEVDPDALCGAVDAAPVADLLGAEVVRRVAVRPGDELGGGVRARFYRCELDTRADGGDPERGLLLSFNPRSSGTAGDARRGLEGEPVLADADCAFDDVPGVDTERGYVQACAGDAGADGGTFVAAGTAVRVDVGRGHLYCQEFSAPTDPSGVDPDDVVATCEELFGAVGR